jgi:hypothetical protein
MRLSLRRLGWIALPVSLACGSNNSSHGGGLLPDSGAATDGNAAQRDGAGPAPDSAGGTDSGGSTDSMAIGQPDSAQAVDSSGTSMDAMMAAGGIPAAGSVDNVDNNFGDVAPNQTPQQATPLGPAMGPDVNVWVNGNNIGAAGDTADYFVFQSSATAGQFTFDICFAAPITTMTASLWKVVNGTQVEPAVGTWTASTTCVTTGMTPAPLAANTEYLFGLTAQGGAGMYSA